MKYAIIHRSEKTIVTLAIFVLLAIAFGILTVRISTPFAIALFLIFLFLLFRVPLMILAKSMEKVEVEKISEVEIKPKDVFKAMIFHSRVYKLTIFFLLAAFAAILIYAPNYVVLPANVLLLTLILPIFENAKVTICKEGIVDSRLILTKWNEIVGVEDKSGWIILKRKYNFPLILPKDVWKNLNLNSLDD